MDYLMQDSLNSNDDINVWELFITAWAYKFFIASTCALGIFFGGYYALNADKIYKSSAIFLLDQSDTGGKYSLGNDFAGMAKLIGLGANSSKEFSTDQIYGRIFIEKLDGKLNFQGDKYFNTYNPNYIDSIWKSRIKRAIGWQKSSTDTQEIIWQGIISKYSKNITLEETPNGSSKIVVKHVNANRAAEIANTIMNEIINSNKMIKDTKQDQQLTYLSNTLAKALNDLEDSQSRLKNFALKNSALPLESFAAGSLQLDTLREQLNRATDLREAAKALLLMLENSTIDQANYFALRQEFPIVDQVEFRRVLGQNEIISSWDWPEVQSVEAVIDTLSERKSRLMSQINASQKDAERSRLALEAFAKLEREAKVSEATYTVLIEQVKAQSMLSGYRPDNSLVYEYAYPSVYTSEPNRNRILSIGAVLGLIVGIALSFVLSFFRDVYYSKSSLITGAQAQFNTNIRTLRPLRNKSLNDINKMLVNNSLTVLRDLAIEIHKNAVSQVIITSSNAKMTSSDVARALAVYMQSDIVKIAIINFSSHNKKLDIDNKISTVGSFVISESTDHVSVLKLGKNVSEMDLVSKRNFMDDIKSLNSTFDLIFLCADNANAISLLSAVEKQKVFHITLMKIKKTKSKTLARMRLLLPIQGLIYD
jgi:uncharacterized protein involved in exopolysaccharide biosynthesis